MRIELTVQHREREHDIAVVAPPEASVGSIGAAAASLCGADPELELWHDGAVVSAELPWQQVGLRTGTVVATAPPTSRQGPPAALSLSVVAGPCAGQTVPLALGRLRIGRGTECDVVLDDPDTSRIHAVVEVERGRVTVSDAGSTNGTTVDGRPIDGAGVGVGVGARIRIGDSMVSVTGPDGPPAITMSTDDGTVRVGRPPRRSVAIPNTTISVPTARTDSRPRPVQWATALVPAAVGGVLVWVTGSLQFLLFALLSPLMMMSGALGDRLHWRSSRRRAAARFAIDSARADERIKSALTREIEIRQRRAPGPADVGRICALPTDRLWERGRGDDDLLVLRLGTGPKSSTAMVERDGQAEPAGVLTDVPICVDLRDGPLGMAGPDASIDGCARWLVAQLASLHSPTDVELVLVLSRSTDTQWRWARWLPHLACRIVDSCSRGELMDELTARLTLPTSDRQAAHRWTGRWTVLVVDRADGIEDLARLSELLRAGPRIGVTAIALARDVAALPAACATVASVAGEQASRFSVHRRGTSTEECLIGDQVTRTWADALARSLAPMLDINPVNARALPARCALEDAHIAIDAESVRRRWMNSTGQARTVLGLGTDGPLTVDLATDGPHALIAGTTGAGKSELLQTLVVGLAVEQSPEELNVLLIDYKGGAAFSDCARLPHTAGVVTDLDPYLTSRALQSLRSELRRRETLLAGSGAADLTAYRRTSATTAIPRLVIVIDEFAALAEELPDFVQGLVAVAQRGRSLGVHLVLATQRPGSAVSTDIRANTALRIALRVTDAAESSDVIDVPDAVTIPRSLPGRAYVRAGSTLRQFQSAWPGACTTVATKQVQVEVLDQWRRPLAPGPAHCVGNDLTRFVDVIVETAARCGTTSARPPWTPPLPEVLERDDLPAPPRPTTIVFGLADLPAQQRREPSALDLETGTSLLIVGSPRSGRTTALVSIVIGAVCQLPPEDLELYVIDPSGPLGSAVADLPHIATVLDGRDPDLVLRLLSRLEDGCAERLRSAATSATRRLLVIDGWDVVLGALDDLEAARCADQLARLMRAALAGGVSVIVSGDRSLLTPRLASGFSRRIALHLNDVTDYSSLGLSTRDVPWPLSPGRAVRAEDAVVLHIAMESAPSVAVGALSTRWPTSAPNPDAIRLRPLPTVVDFSTLVLSPTHQQCPPHGLRPPVLGLAGDEATALTIDLEGNPDHLIVAGPPRSGRSTVLRLLYRQARAAGLATIIAAGARSPLAVEARADGTTVLDPVDDPGSTVSPGPRPTLLLLDDCELWLDSPLGAVITKWLQGSRPALSAVVTGRAEDFATTYRGVGAQVRRNQRGILLRPGPIDGELLGIRLPRRPSAGPPGRGVMVGDPHWDPRFAAGQPVPVQIARLDDP